MAFDELSWAFMAMPWVRSTWGQSLLNYCELMRTVRWAVQPRPPINGSTCGGSWHVSWAVPWHWHGICHGVCRNGWYCQGPKLGGLYQNVFLGDPHFRNSIPYRTQPYIKMKVKSDEEFSGIVQSMV